MKTNNVLNLIKKQDIIVPRILIDNKKKLNINEKELLFLSFLMSFGDYVFCDINLFCDKLGYEINDVMEVFSTLEEKKLIDMIVRKEKEFIKEYIDISNLYNILASFIIECEVAANEEKNDSSRIYEDIEKEFGRMLSPIEYETIKGWLDSNVDESLIHEALKEAVLNGVNNIKYIEKILYEWGKKGYKKAVDVKKKNDVSEENIDLFEYDWINDKELD